MSSMTRTTTPEPRRRSVHDGPETATLTHDLDDATDAADSEGRPSGGLSPFGTEDDRLVLSVAEAGERLGLSRAFAYELVARGELPVVRFGRRIVVPKAALLELLASASADH
jgi:excisionase family DNA binding protein